MELTNEQLEHIRKECAQVNFGRVIIELNAHSGKIDVITEKRIRMRLEPERRALVDN